MLALREQAEEGGFGTPDSQRTGTTNLPLAIVDIVVIRVAATKACTTSSIHPPEARPHSPLDCKAGVPMGVETLRALAWGPVRPLSLLRGGILRWETNGRSRPVACHAFSISQ